MDRIKRLIAVAVIALGGSIVASAQNSLPLPGQGSNPGPVMGGSSSKAIWHNSTPGPVMGGSSSNSIWHNSNPGPVMGGSSSAGGTSVAAPGTGGSFRPNLPNNGIGWRPDPWHQHHWWNTGWGWNDGWNGFPTVIPVGVQIPAKGVMKVVACGFDAQGIWRNIPMVVAYRATGVQYKVVVISAWNPWSQMWDNDIYAPAYNTAYYMNGVTYAFYAPLSTGTYYFNL